MMNDMLIQILLNALKKAQDMNNDNFKLSVFNKMRIVIQRITEQLISDTIIYNR